MKGSRLRVKTKRNYYDSDGTTHLFSDIVGVMPLGIDEQRNTELGMDMALYQGHRFADIIVRLSALGIWAKIRQNGDLGRGRRAIPADMKM